MNQRSPRQHNEKHLAFIRTLPCLLCNNNIETEACHVRMADRSIAKPNGFGAKPDDRFTVPLCGTHHREQHQHGENAWWTGKGTDPIKAALALYSVSGDFEAGCRIVAANCERCTA